MLSSDFVRPVEMQSKSDSPKLKEDADIPVGIKPTKSKGTAAGPKNTKSSSALSITKTKPASNVNKVQQPEMAAGTTVTVAATPLSVNTTKSKPVTPMVSPLQEAVPSHVVLTVEAVQPITTHVSGKKQAAVKAVPRAKLEGEELAKEQHVKVSACVCCLLSCKIPQIPFKPLYVQRNFPMTLYSNAEQIP